MKLRFRSAVWRNSAFSAFLLARLAGMLATQIQAVVIGWQVYELTGEAMALAYVGLAQFIPMLILLMPAGDLIDRYARKPILMATWMVATLCAVALWALAEYAAGAEESGKAAALTGIYITLVLFGCSRAFSGPTLQSLLPQSQRRRVRPRGRSRTWRLVYFGCRWPVDAPLPNAQASR
jgi:MFS family permease